MNILIIGSGGREHAIARALARSPIKPKIYSFGAYKNPGISEVAARCHIGDIRHPEAILAVAEKNSIDWAIVGPEEPLEAGAADILELHGIGCFGPKKALAQIETSKAFAKDLMTRYQIPGRPLYRVFTSMYGVKEFLHRLGRHNYVVKADGLTGGKGVKVGGEHLRDEVEAADFCRGLLFRDGQCVVEEKLIGQEFSLMSFSDGKTVVHMPPVQDHKRAFENDHGPNTGGMGSYTDSNGLLPFLVEADIRKARKINELTVAALAEEFSQGYQGVLYGGYMVCAKGVKLLEFNARFGDPEGINILALLETDLAQIGQAIVEQRLAELSIGFQKKATVCKYIAPEGYPDHGLKGQPIELNEIFPEHIFYAGLEKKSDQLFLRGSRALAVLGIGDTLEAAELRAEAEARKVSGPVFHRTDIGTRSLLDSKLAMMKLIRPEIAVS